MNNKADSETLASYWQQHIEAWQSSGQSQQAYCKVNELIYHRFGYWLRKFRQPSQAVQSRRGSGFIPVTHTAPTQSTGLSLSIPGGLVLHGIAEDNLSVVDQLLGRLT